VNLTNNLEEVSLDERKLLAFFRQCCMDTDLIHLTKDRIHWWNIVNRIIYDRVPKRLYTLHLLTLSRREREREREGKEVSV
jgi:hypothetical protein